MLAKEAHTLIMNELKGMKAIKCHEYKTLYVFQVVPQSYKSDADPNKLFDSLVSVNKTTKEVRDFKPFYIPANEYKQGREINNFNK